MDFQGEIMGVPDKLKGDSSARRQPGHREDAGSQRPERRQSSRSRQSGEQGRGRGRRRQRRSRSDAGSN